MGSNPTLSAKIGYTPGKTVVLIEKIKTAVFFISCRLCPFSVQKRRYAFCISVSEIIKEIIFAQRRKTIFRNHPIGRRISFITTRRYFEMQKPSGKIGSRAKSGFSIAFFLMFGKNTAPKFGKSVRRKVPKDRLSDHFSAFAESNGKIDRVAHLHIKQK